MKINNTKKEQNKYNNKRNKKNKKLKKSFISTNNFNKE